MTLFLVVNALEDFEDIAVKLPSSTSPETFAQKHGFEWRGSVANLSNYFLFRKPLSTTAPSEWFQTQTKRQLQRREFLDPLFSQQWHWSELSLEGAWETGQTGQGIVISILDDGVDFQHPDLKAAYLSELSYDINRGRKIIQLDREDWHGTRAAGLALARDNSVCGVGSAYRASLAAVRMIARPTSDADEAQGISYGAPTVDIYSASWGPPDDGRRLEGPGHLALETLEAVVQGNSLHQHLHGRDGKGSIYVWSAGNGHQAGDNCNYDGWANSRLTITVASVTDLGTPTPYSEHCCAILTTAPSGGGRRSITTSENEESCTEHFSGTSASTPMVAGIVALILQANPSLTWRAVQHILIASSSPVASDIGQLNGAGLHYSHLFGFGILNATTAVTLALEMDDLSGVELLEFCQPVNQHIGELTDFVTNILVPEHGTLEHVEVVFDASHRHRGELSIVLISPCQTQSRLAEMHSDPHPDYTQWKMMSLAHWGEQSAGNWTLIVRDNRRNSVSGSFNEWCLRLWATV